MVGALGSWYTLYREVEARGWGIQAKPELCRNPPCLPPPQLPADDTWNKNAGMMVMGLNKMVRLIRNDKAITL